MLPDDVCGRLAAWWLVYGANVPNWDLASTCTVGGRRGIVLVEAKANAAELKAGGKVLAKNASPRSRANHERIGAAIGEACAGLSRVVPGVRISRDHCYQLSNRIATAWKLASMGVPTVLMYLGFLGDAGICDVGPPLASPEEWRRLFWEHAKCVLPEFFGDGPIDCGGATMQLIVRSLEVISVSPSKGSPSATGRGR